MPEGPEVRKISEDLAVRLSNRTIMSAEIISGRYQKHGLPDGFDQMLDNLPVRIVGAGCHGKFIFIILDGGSSIWCTLGMTGTWSEKRGKHSRVMFRLDDGDVFFNDMRNFGTLKYKHDKKDLIQKIESLGPDMLSENLSDQDFYKIIMSCKDKTIAQAIMDQKVIAGVGNYLKAECLYFSRISPHRKCNTLTLDEASSLNTAIKKTIRDSYNFGGATIRSYAGFYGEVGEYSARFAVYNQKRDPMGREVIREKTRDGRTTHWVPEFQN
tara:strand:+ start:274 stop:1080 length:807 start_codon:yes stop_codon:yes gene_type:complete